MFRKNVNHKPFAVSTWSITSHRLSVCVHRQRSDFVHHFHYFLLQTSPLAGEGNGIQWYDTVRQQGQRMTRNVTIMDNPCVKCDPLGIDKDHRNNRQNQTNKMMAYCGSSWISCLLTLIHTSCPDVTRMMEIRWQISQQSKVFQGTVQQGEGIYKMMVKSAETQIIEHRVCW